MPKYPDKSRWVAILSALVFGSFGTHRFYLEENKTGVKYLLFFWTGVPLILGIVDAFRYLIPLEEEFGRGGSTDSVTKESGADTVRNGQSEEPEPNYGNFSTSELQPGEEILDSVPAHVGEFMGDGDDKQINGVLILTNQRLVFRGKRFFTERAEEIPLSQIKTVSTETGMMMGTVKVNLFKFTTQNKTDHKRLARKLQRARREAESSSRAPQSGGDGGLDPVEKLEKLNALREKGALSDEEFQRKKAELLEKV